MDRSTNAVVREIADSVTTADGVCRVTLFAPDQSDQLRCIVMLPDVAGTRPTFEDMARTLAGFGYAVLLPDLYYRHADRVPFCLPAAFTDPTERARMMAMGDAITVEMMESDAIAYFDYLDTRPEVRGGTFGLCGYCRGGRISLTVAGRTPGRVAAVASIHGSQLASNRPDSPHLRATQMLAKVYVAAAQGDELFPAEQARTLRDAFLAAGVGHEIDMYPAQHGFAVPDNPGYDDDAAQRHWTAVRDFFASALR